MGGSFGGDECRKEKKYQVYLSGFRITKTEIENTIKKGSLLWQL